MPGLQRAARAATQPVGFLPPRLQTPSAHRWALRAIVALLIVAVASCFAVGASRPPVPSLLPAASGAGLDGHSSPSSRVAGFGQIGFRVIQPGARTVGAVRCALLADTAQRQATGMMGRRDLGGYDAMIFRFTAPTMAGFYNKGVPVPISVAWFDPVGVFVGEATMAVCTATCPTVRPGPPYLLALEVPGGGLRHLGVGPGSVVMIGGSCGA